MKLYQIKCPACGGNINVEEEKKFWFCPYCGTKVYADDEVKRVEITRIYKNETKIKENEIKNQIHSRELEYKERQEKRDNMIGIAMLVSVIFIILLGGVIWWQYAKSVVEVPVDAKKYKGEEYNQVIRELKDIGFENIETEVIEDLVTGWITKNGEVEKVSINGNNEFEKGDNFKKDSTVVVTYHALKEK